MTSTAINSQLGTQQFLQLLASQVQYQDPLEPIKNQDFLAQLAQFSSLGSLEQLNSQFASFSASQQLTQSTSLLGHLVTFNQPGGLEGVVDQLRLRSGETEAQVQGQWIPVKNISSVRIQ